MKPILSFLSRHPFFKNMPEKELRVFAARAKRRSVNPDEALIVQDFSADTVYLIHQGSFFIRSIENGEEVLIDTRKRGEFICENAIEGNLECPYTAVALENSEIIAFPGKGFRSMLRKFPETAKKFFYISRQAQTQIDFFKKTVSFYNNRDEKVSLSIFSVDPTLPFLLSKLNYSIGGDKQLEYCRTIAFYAREIARFLCPFMEGVLYWAAFLHEIGKLTLNNYELAQFKERTARLTFKSDMLQAVYERTLQVLAPDPGLSEQMGFIRYLTGTNWNEMPVPAQILKAAKDFTDLISCLAREGAIAVMRSRADRYNPLILDTLELFFDKEHNLRLNSALSNLRIINEALDRKGGINSLHCQKVSELATAIATRVGISIEEIEEIKIGAELHNVGMISVPSEQLNRKGRMTKDEFKSMQKHPLYLDEFLSKNIPALERIGNFTKYHHENYDGSGYPFALSGEDIPLPARILRIADVYCALCSKRNYRINRQGESIVYDKKRALKIMRSMQPGVFDPVLFDVFIEIINEREN